MTMSKKDDLLTTLGQKANDSVNADGKSSNANTDTTSDTPIGGDTTSDKVSRGTNLLGEVETDKETKSKTESDTSSKDASSKTTDAPDKTVKDPDTWTKESALKEVTRLRDEAKTTRIKSKEQLEALRTEMEKKLNTLTEQFKEAEKAKKKLETMEANEADKKRNLEEKLAHRETVITELQSQMDALKQEYENRIDDMTGKVSEFEAEREAQKQVYQERINEEINKIPEKFKKFAESMVKGFSDPREGWSALAEAKAQGLFEDKTIVVNHDVPGAKDGARITKEKLESDERDKIKKMTSAQKIKAGLDSIRGGNPNSVFRER